MNGTTSHIRKTNPDPFLFNSYTVLVFDQNLQVSTILDHIIHFLFIDQFLQSGILTVYCVYFEFSAQFSQIPYMQKKVKNRFNGRDRSKYESAGTGA